MKIAILGITGMLGHKLWQEARQHKDLDVWGVTRAPRERLSPSTLFRADFVVDRFDVLEGDLERLRALRPSVLVNCVGIVKQVRAASDPILSIQVNSLFPHRLAVLADEIQARLIHISTDCVFRGAKGRYSEVEDFPDATDLYGRSKLLGELADSPHCVTLRTSIIGRELTSANGLVEWFLSNRGKRVKGFKRAVFSGLTTAELARVIVRVITRHESLSGLYHVASDPIDKCSLLGLMNDAFHAGVDIVPDESVRIDRSLDGSRFREKTGWVAPPWPTMISELAADTTPYDAWRTV